MVYVQPKALFLASWRQSYRSPFLWGAAGLAVVLSWVAVHLPLPLRSPGWTSLSFAAVLTQVWAMGVALWSCLQGCHGSSHQSPISPTLGALAHFAGALILPSALTLSVTGAHVAWAGLAGDLMGTLPGEESAEMLPRYAAVGAMSCVLLMVLMAWASGLQRVMGPTGRLTVLSLVIMTAFLLPDAPSNPSGFTIWFLPQLQALSPTVLAEIDPRPLDWWQLIFYGCGHSVTVVTAGALAANALARRGYFVDATP